MTRTERTEAVINYFKGLDNEFSMLKGLLCAGHGLEPKDCREFEQFFDTIRLAERMDEINTIARAHARQRQAATESQP